MLVFLKYGLKTVKAFIDYSLCFGLFLKQCTSNPILFFLNYSIWSNHIHILCLLLFVVWYYSAAAWIRIFCCSRRKGLTNPLIMQLDYLNYRGVCLHWFSSLELCAKLWSFVSFTQLLSFCFSPDLLEGSRKSWLSRKLAVGLLSCCLFSPLYLRCRAVLSSYHTHYITYWPAKIIKNDDQQSITSIFAKKEKVEGQWPVPCRSAKKQRMEAVLARTEKCIT